MQLRNGSSQRDWVPFACTIGMFVLAFGGLAYSLFPYLVIDRITIWEAAAATGSLKIILVGAAVDAAGDPAPTRCTATACSGAAAPSSATSGQGRQAGRRSAAA